MKNYNKSRAEENKKVLDVCEVIMTASGKVMKSCVIMTICAFFVGLGASLTYDMKSSNNKSK